MQEDGLTFREWLFGRREGEAPKEVREAKHHLVNEVSQFQYSLRRLAEKPDALEILLKAVREDH